jgi:hypothetical protein
MEMDARFKAQMHQQKMQEMAMHAAMPRPAAQPKEAAE